MNLRRFAGLFHLLVAAVLMLAVWMLLVFTSSRPALRGLIDLTPQRVHSVDPATEEMMRDLAEKNVKVGFHLFFPRITGAARDPVQQQELVIRDRLQKATRMLVQHYAWLGGDAVEVHYHDLVNDLAATREAAQRFDYKGPYDAIVVTVREPGQEQRFRMLSLADDLAEIRRPDDQPQGAPVAQAKVPVLKAYLGEVAISSAIKSLLVQGTPVVYVLRGYSKGLDYTNESIGHAYGNLIAALDGLGMRTATLDLGRQATVPPDAAMVMLLEPRMELPDRHAQALYEYLRRGGRLFINYAWSPVARDYNPTGGRLGELLGFEVGRLPVFHMIRDVSGRTGGRWLDGDPAVRKLELQLNSHHPVTRTLARSGRPMEVAEARELRPLAKLPEGIKVEPLLKSGPRGWLPRPGPDGRFSYDAPSIGLREFVVGMAIEVEPPGKVEGSGAEDGRRPGEVVLVSGLFCNNVGLPLFGDLVFNICNWMTERKVLMNIQSSRYRAEQMDVSPAQTARVRVFLAWIVPGALLVAGLIVIFVRRRI